ncbi:hypothetical protein LOC67_07590 [Stieleria sp. JC731]|uniref:hypothetical protein n=1 Tax=Pirellulaceae TaxID=2691357 RepID=UPI001E50A75A|nr:hypothetical protein [Stieleria sp. JC731]MCC9600419.1 hypothetical protein [Stieleria sp. JC731]
MNCPKPLQSTIPWAFAFSVTLGVLMLDIRRGVAQDRLHAVVSPALEIEVIDPGVDPLGNPAVQLHDTGNALVVDIPPTVLVHRYYYTGDRSFRGPDLPGGPTIVVASHPRTGERTYVQVQMLPGSPMVHYSAKSIDFDFGDAGIEVVFPRYGCPKVKVRSGRRLTDRIDHVLHIEEIRNAKEEIIKSQTRTPKRIALAAEGLLLTAKDAVGPITQPVEHLARLIPGYVAFTDPNTEIENAKRAIEFNNELRRKHQAFHTRLDELDMKTTR